MDKNNEDMCVICFKRNFQNNFSCLYENENDLTEIGRQYQDIIQTSVTNLNNKSPKYLCPPCEKRVISFNQFRTKAIESYWRILKEINPIDTSTDKYVKIEEITIIDANTETATEKFQIKYLDDDIEDNNDGTGDNGGTGDNKPQSFSPDINNSNIENQNSSENQCNTQEKQVQISDGILHTDGIMHNGIVHTNGIMETDKVIENDKITNNDIKIAKAENFLETGKQIKAILCRLCLRAFKFEYDFQRHMKNEHNKPELKNNRRNLKKDKKVIISNKIVNNYLRTGKLEESFNLDENSNAILCRLCLRAFKFESDFLKHMSDEHNPVVKFKCKQCNLLYQTYEQLLCHTKTKHSDRTLTCPMCNKTFVHRSSFSAHKKMHLDERPYVCEICGKGFRSRSHYNYHKYSHMEKQFKCEICYNLYSSPRTLADHMKFVHTYKIKYPQRKK